jgi:hypothetical protein
MFRAAPICLLASVALAAPAPKGKGPTLYHATKVGDTLVYEHTQGDKVTEKTVTVDAVEEKDGVYTVTTKRSDGGTEKVQVSEEGMVVPPTGAPGSLSVPITMLKLPAKQGDTWEWGDKGRGYTTTYVGEEEIEVPAGRMKARRVALNVAPTITLSVWLVKGIGPVKMTTEGTGVVQVLKSFKPGK